MSVDVAPHACAHTDERATNALYTPHTVQNTFSKTHIIIYYYYYLALRAGNAARVNGEAGGTQTYLVPSVQGAAAVPPVH